jgi:Alpha/beta hydrolase
VPVYTADPTLLRRLALDLGRAADTVLVTAATAARVSEDVTAVVTVGPVARWATEWARSLTERAELLETMAPVTPTLVETSQLVARIRAADHALTTPDPINWGALDGAVDAAAGAVDWLLRHQSATVAAGFLASLDPTVAAALARRRPELGDLAGAPLEVTFAANRRRIECAIADLDWRLGTADHDTAVALAAERDTLAGMLTRDFVLFDWSGDGRVAEWVGPVDADHVLVLVPGMGTDKMDTDAMAANAARLLGADRGGGLAVVTALVYDAPDGIDVVLPSDAASGAGRLADLVASLSIADRHLTLVAHSYGALVLGKALASGLAAELPSRHDIVFLGAPGTGVGTAAQLGVDPKRVWAGGAVDDPVIVLRRLAGVFGPLVADLYLDSAFGTPPTDPAFGARVFDAGGGGHSSYLAAGDLADHGGRVYHGTAPVTMTLGALVAIATARRRNEPRDRRDKTSGTGQASYG